MLIATIFILSATTIIVLASGAFNGEGEPPETTFVRTTPTPATSDTPTATYIPLRELVPEEPETPEETETESPQYHIVHTTNASTVWGWVDADKVVKA